MAVVKESVYLTNQESIDNGDGLEELKPVAKIPKSKYLDILGKYKTDLEHMKHSRDMIVNNIEEGDEDNEEIKKKIKEMDEKIDLLEEAIDELERGED